MSRPLSRYHQARLDARFRKAWREEDWQANDRRCTYCLATLTRADLTFDHVEPRSKGGGDRRENGAAACRLCNALKGSLPPATFMRMMKGQIPACWDIQVQAAVRRVNRRAMAACRRIAAMVPASAQRGVHGDTGNA